MNTSILGTFAALWGLLGVLFNLGYAVYRVVPYSVAAFQMPLKWYHWIVMVAFALQMLYSEAYKGFHLKFCPRVTARMRYLRHHFNWRDALLAPIFCVGYYNASKRTKIVAYGIFIFVFVIVRLMQFIPQPWRGVIDVGVVVGLSAGMLSLIYHAIWAFSDKPFPFSADVQNEH
jgi:hypothetical protein